MASPKEEFKIFISHATLADGLLASWIADSLDRLHIRCYIYESYQRGGQNRFETIKDLIKICPYFLVILTKDGIASQWVNQEIGYAVGVGKEIIPIIEIDSITGKGIESSGFIELHDPITLDKKHHELMMHNIIYTFYSLLTSINRWADSITLNCECGKCFEGKVDYGNNISLPFQKDQFSIQYSCPVCNNILTVSLPDYHQKGSWIDINLNSQ